jgi:hypothetical protein
MFGARRLTTTVATVAIRILTQYLLVRERGCRLGHQP